MVTLTVDDLLPYDEYASKRKEYFNSHRRYLERFRRVRIGPNITLIFENRQTLWFRVQEVIRVARLARVEDLQQELNLYNRLLPDGNRLQAALLIDRSESAETTDPLSAGFSGFDLFLRMGDHHFPAALITNRPEDLAAGTALWVQFAVADVHRTLFGQMELSARFHCKWADEHFESAELSEDFRLSLLDDLEIATSSNAKRTG